MPITKKYQIANNLIEVQVRYQQNSMPIEDYQVDEIRSIRDSLVQSRISNIGFQPISNIQLSEVAL